MKRTRRVAVVLAAVAGLLVGVWFYRVASSLSGSGSIADLWRGISNPRSLFPGKDRLTILVLGRDYNHDRKAQAYTKGSRADTIMVLSVDLAQGRMSALSIPRDTRIKGADGLEGKANGLLARGGIDLVRNTLSTQLGIDTDYYVLIKPDAVRNIVNELGGVEVETIDAMKYDDNWGGLHIDLPKGRQVVNGQQAEGYVRFREVNRFRLDSRGRQIPIRGVQGSLEEGDIRRTARQQQLIRAMMQKATSPAVLVKADKVINTGFGQIETNLDRTQAIALATILKESGAKGMQNGTLPGSDAKIRGIYYYELDAERAPRMIDWLVKGNELAVFSLIRVQVFNGTKVAGLARRTADKIAASGYDASSAGNAREPVAKTEVVFHQAAFEEHAQAIAKAIGAGAARKDPSLPRNAAEVIVTVGPDLAGQLTRVYRRS